MTLVQPDGTIIDPTLAGTDRYITFTSGSTYEFYKIEAPQPGAWTVRIFGKQTSSSTEAYTVLASTRDATILSVDLDKTEYSVGDAISFTASIQDSFSAAPTGPEYIDGVTMLVTTKDPAQNTSTFELYDDGQHGDGAANDGVYANTFNNTGLEGSYNFNVQIAGENNRDNAILTEPASSRANGLKTRRLPPVGCTPCWALLPFARKPTIRFSHYRNITCP